MSAEARPSPAKVRILVLQFARLGDTLQSLMALRAAKQLYPQLEIHFVAREKFAAAAKRVPWLAEVITLPSDALLGPILSGKKNEAEALRDVARWVSPLIQQPWDFVVNWTYSDASSWLAGLLPARVKLGFSRRRDHTLSSSDGWSHYIQAIVMGGIDQNIHLTDILTTQLLTALQIHVGEPADEGEAPVTSKGFFSLSVPTRDIGWGWRDPSRKWIGIQLGAGAESRSWDAKSWARLASMILGRHPECSIVLLGGKEDEDRERLFMSSLDASVRDGRQILSLVGRSDFDLWATVVGRCQWVMAGDTAVLHLASVLGTRVLNLSLGGVRSNETGPYGNGHYVIASNRACAGCAAREENATHSCRDDITPEAVYATWSYAIGEWAHRRQVGIENHFSQQGHAKELTQIRISRSRIRSTNDGGGVVYEPLIQRSLRIDDWSSQVMGHVARAWYCGWVPPIGQELVRGSVSPALIQSLRQLDEASSVLTKVCEEAQRTATTLEQRSSRLRSDKLMPVADRQEIQSLGKKLTELDQLVDRLATAHATLKGFATMSKVLMHNLKGEQLADLGRESAASYQQLLQGVALMRDWIKHTLELARPVAIAGNKKEASVITLRNSP